jgi:hypothetical protein
MTLDHSFGRGSLAVAIVVAGLCASACQDKAPTARAPVASPAAPVQDGGLRPLTSRDGAPPPSAAGGMALAGPATAPLPPGHPPLSGAGPGPALPADPSASIAGTVALAPSVASRVGSADVLYVIARNAKTNAVVAVRREEGIRFPHAFQVSSADLMMEGTTFTGPFDVTARVSKTGDAIPGKGDLEGTTRGVAVGARGVSVTIDSVRQ